MATLGRVYSNGFSDGAYSSRVAAERAERAALDAGDIVAAAQIRAELIGYRVSERAQRRALVRAIGDYASLGDAEAMAVVVRRGLSWLTPRRAVDFRRTCDVVFDGLEEVADPLMCHVARLEMERWVDFGRLHWAVGEAPVGASRAVPSIGLVEPYLAALVRASSAAALVIHEELAPLVTVEPRAARAVAQWAARNVDVLAGRPEAVAVVGDLLDRGRPLLGRSGQRAVDRVQRRLELAFAQGVPEVQAFER